MLIPCSKHTYHVMCVLALQVYVTVDKEIYISYGTTNIIGLLVYIVLYKWNLHGLRGIIPYNII